MDVDRHQAVLHSDGIRCLLAANACANAGDAIVMTHEHPSRVSKLVFHACSSNLEP